MKQTFGVVLAGLCGLTAGIVGSIIAPQNRTAAPVAMLNAPVKEGREGAELQRRMRTLEGKLHLLESREAVPDGAEQQDGEPTKTEESSTAEDDPSPVSDDEAREREYAAWDASLEQHAAETEDVDWAVPMASHFAADLEQFAPEKGFVFLNARCKTTTCSAQVRWPDYQTALKNYGDLLHHSYSENRCTRTTMLPPPREEEMGHPYVTTVLYECSSSRQG